ncbi:MAG: hypothetical protein O3C61_06795 [Proteobacteria bacterium]|nr:hypothetical protein [Pseudomonadota bacterium]
MKTFNNNNNRRKIFSSNNRRTSPNRGSADSPYMTQQGNTGNGYSRNNKNFKDQHADYLIKAKDAISNGDEVLEQYYLQHAEHCFRQLDETIKETTINKDDLPKTIVSKKIIKKSTIEKKTNTESVQEKLETKTDFDDFANQLA